MEYSSKSLKSAPFGGKRTDRLGDQIKMEIADILIKKAKDPRVAMVTVLSVDVSPDIAHAKVYVSLPCSSSSEKSSTEKETIRGLNNAAGFVRSELSRRLALKRVPDISFFVDQSVEQVSHLLTLLEQIGDEQNQQEVLGAE
jgi:ribosome-binding factor A